MTLNPEESSILGLIAQYSRLKRVRTDLEEMIEGLGPEAKRVARILLDDNARGATADEKAAAKAYRAWHKTNVKIGSRRVQASVKASRRLRLGSQVAPKKIEA